MSILCGTKCSQIVEVCAQSKQHYQRLLPWGLLCHRTREKSPQILIILLDVAPYLLHRERSQITPRIKEHHNHVIGFSRSILQRADTNSPDVTDSSIPHSEARPLGVCCHSQTGLRDLIARLFRRGRSGSTTRELGGLPVFFQHANGT